MNSPTPPFPRYAVYLALVGFLLTLRAVLLLVAGLPPMVGAAGLALWAMTLYWGLVVILLRSDPRVWQSGSRWYRLHAATAPEADRRELLARVRDELAPLLQRELMVMAAVGAASGMIGQSTGLVALAAGFAVIGAWGLGAALKLRGQ